MPSYRSASGPGFEQRRIDRAPIRELACLQDILDAFETRGQRFEVLGRPNRSDRFEPRFHVDQIVASAASTALTSSYANPRTSRK